MGQIKVFFTPYRIYHIISTNILDEGVNVRGHSESIRKV
jgi:hypothetical protein